MQSAAQSSRTSAKMNRSANAAPSNAIPASLRTALWAPSQPTSQSALRRDSPSFDRSVASIAVSLFSTATSSVPHVVWQPSVASRARNRASISACPITRRPGVTPSDRPPTSMRVSRRSPTQILIARACTASSGRSPSAPRRARISLPRGCNPSAREVVAGAAALSMIATSMPRLRRSHASARPVGPAPTMSTFVRRARTWLMTIPFEMPDLPCVGHSWGASGSRGGRRAAMRRCA